MPRFCTGCYDAPAVSHSDLCGACKDAPGRVEDPRQGELLGWAMARRRAALDALVAEAQAMGPYE